MSLTVENHRKRCGRGWTPAAWTVHVVYCPLIVDRGRYHQTKGLDAEKTGAWKLTKTASVPWLFIGMAILSLQIWIRLLWAYVTFDEFVFYEWMSEAAFNLAWAIFQPYWQVLCYTDFTLYLKSYDLSSSTAMLKRFILRITVPRNVKIF